MLNWLRGQRVHSHLAFLFALRRGFFYLLDYVTSTDFSQMGDRQKKKKKDMGPIYHNFYVVYRGRVRFQNNYFLSDF